MSTPKVEKIELANNFKKSDYASQPKNEEKEEENYFLNMKAEDAEIKRASNQLRDIYRLKLQAKGGNCNAIKKLINYSFNDFGLDSEYAQSLKEESQQLLKEQQEIYVSSCGKLSDISKDFAQEEIIKNDHGKLTDTEKAQQYNDLIADMEIGCYSI